MPALALLVLLIARIASAGTTAPGFVETTAIQGLTVPTAIAFLPDGRLLVTQQSGELLLVTGGVTSTLATVPVCFSSFDPATASPRTHFSPTRRSRCAPAANGAKPSEWPSTSASLPRSTLSV